MVDGHKFAIRLLDFFLSLNQLAWLHRVTADRLLVDVRHAMQFVSFVTRTKKQPTTFVGIVLQGVRDQFAN